jgi:hypothetical protein
MEERTLIERHARRMTIEQRLAQSIRSFHIDALASSVFLNVDLDVVLSVLAGSYGYRRRLPAIMGTEGVGRAIASGQRCERRR